MKLTHALLLAAVALSTAQHASAAALARPEPNRLDAAGRAVRDFVEAAAHEFNLYVAHGCQYVPAGSPETTAILAITPSGPRSAFDRLTPSLDAGGRPVLDANRRPIMLAAPLDKVFWSRRRDAATGQMIEYDTGPLLNLRPSTNEIGARTRSYWEDIGGYAHHGREQTDSVSALLWHGFRLSDQFYTDLKFRATTARLRGCISAASVQVPVWKICGPRDFTSFSAHPALRGANDFVPTFRIVRNEIANPYPAECATDLSRRIEVTVSPSAAQIEKYLTMTRLPGRRTAHSFHH